MKFNVPGYGVIGLDHAIWMYCMELSSIKALAVGETAYFVMFRTGAGTTSTTVQRVE